MHNITLTKEELQAVLTALSKFPYDQVTSIINKILKQTVANDDDEEITSKSIDEEIFSCKGMTRM